MKPENNIWLFMGVGGRFPASAFTEKSAAEAWIAKHKLTGMLSAMPVNKGVFEWAVENDALNLKPEKLEDKCRDSRFIGTCTSASLEHYHYAKGVRV